MLKIRNRETGEVADLSRDVCIAHPAWVHEQCGTASESELQHMLDQMSYAEFAQNPDSEDAAGVFMTADTAKDYLGEIAAREYHAERFDD
ncbi:MAG: hypothetical protein ACT4QB_19595 [Gammaproteobacteria bacterium]